MSRLHAIRALTAVPNIGDRLATRFYEELGIRSVAELVDAGLTHRLQNLSGIGARREAQILEAAMASVPEHAPHSLANMLRCPSCRRDGLELSSVAAKCVECRRQFTFERGVIDLVPPTQRDRRTVSQRLMETRLYARVYEDVMRPKLAQAIGEAPDDRAVVTDFLELDSATAVLDVACGTGRFLRSFARSVQHEPSPPMLVGVDMSWQLLESARDGLRRADIHEQVTLVRTGTTRLPMQDASFDRLHCSGALHIIEDIDRALDECARVLAPGGVCVIGTLVTGDGLLRRAMRRLAEIPSKFHLFGPGELHRRLARVGLRVVDERRQGDRLTVKAVRSESPES